MIIILDCRFLVWHTGMSLCALARALVFQWPAHIAKKLRIAGTSASAYTLQPGHGLSFNIATNTSDAGRSTTCSKSYIKRLHF